MIRDPGIHRSGPVTARVAGFQSPFAADAVFQQLRSSVRLVARLKGPAKDGGRGSSNDGKVVTAGRREGFVGGVGHCEGSSGGSG